MLARWKSLVCSVLFILLTTAPALAKKPPYVAPVEPPKPPAPSEADLDTCGPGTQLHKTRTERYCYFPNYNKEGLWIFWHDNGQKKAETRMKQGKREGLRTLWHDNGQKKEESHWKDDKEQGRHLEWNKDGKKSAEVDYKDGKKDGE